MPKIKTNRCAYKKFRSTSKGKVKRSQAYKSHNTAKKSPKRRRQLREILMMEACDAPGIKRLLPYLSKRH